MRDAPRRIVGHAPPPDVARIARSFSYPGIDPRLWASAGTVGTFDDEGIFVTAGEIGRLSVASERHGCIIDVRLEPCRELVTARYHGLGFGRYGGVLVPIAAGDEVLVVVPDGNLNSPAITIVALGSNATAPLPTDWANDRLLIEAFFGPVHIRAPNVRIDSPNLILNGRRVASGSTPI